MSYTTSKMLQSCNVSNTTTTNSTTKLRHISNSRQSRHDSKSLIIIVLLRKRVSGSCRIRTAM
ncbi:hypothetical protein F2Q69_00060425 [Brassica cretica]|uniref:Uncharacterized protein n=1 Tax=Brassica cretica TaxID=69181 RepID=A0A8S9RGX6_BRACR|nr:hypothetical protein F2Q69_00060425 [Brassica cretica]